ncbi:hypothetical protein H5398_14170 [Tessaracoccus sp. MC1679]|uniref:hypothetical protein n=1 Tax=Tessaracoccus sp. MC1679 TaxID=2760313 RepID=UPI0015FF7625|nr:hypothetical protein [Tessaracoccus sp. MC1679]MBB1517100.1 hypothetical protein [Tessaracoccus sp. MC1679]
MSAKRILLKTAAASAVILLGTTTVASAHHCYKDQWADAAYQHHLAGGTAWMPLSDMGAEFLIPDHLKEACGWAADTAVQEFMEAEGLEQEPLIHSKAITGGGAYAKGKAPKPFSYLTEAQFGSLTESLLGYVAECASELPD